MSVALMDPKLSNSFYHASGNLKEHVALKELCDIHNIVHSKNFLSKYKADQTLFSWIPLREETRYLLFPSYIYESDLPSCGETLCLKVLENLGIYWMIWLH